MDQDTSAHGLPSYGPGNDTIAAHAEAIVDAIRRAPAGTRVAAPARDDATFLGIRVFRNEERTDADSDVLPDDEVEYYWDANPEATTDTVTSLVHGFREELALHT